MKKETKERFKQLIGESTAKGKNSLLCSDNVTNEKLAEKLSESENIDKEVQLRKQAFEKKLHEGWN